MFEPVVVAIVLFIFARRSFKADTEAARFSPDATEAAGWAGFGGDGDDFKTGRLDFGFSGDPFVP